MGYLKGMLGVFVCVFVRCQRVLLNYKSENTALEEASGQFPPYVSVFTLSIIMVGQPDVSCLLVSLTWHSQQYVGYAPQSESIQAIRSAFWFTEKTGGREVC